MARSPVVTKFEAPDPNAINLTRLLSRLEAVILAPEFGTDSRRLRKSSYERAKVGAVGRARNLEYARTLLLRLEHESSGIKIQSRKQASQTDLRAKRETIKRLNERLYELGQLGAEAVSSDDEDGEDILGEIDGIDDAGETKTTSTPPDLNRSSPLLAQPAAEPSQSPPADTSNVRSRRTPKSPASEDTATTTSTSTSLPQSESLLSHNRSEQEDLTSSLLTMAQSLKTSSKAFASSLESEKETLDRAGEGLEKNATGMAAAEKRMGTLRRMTEGRGWWGRMIMYAWIAGLMFVALFIVAFLPKLRF
ncbi:MAG: hypothetical protein M1837_001504 [Sclerophora amabilis]|nr:MAG: hypothetical protein M1837_001504 [Sclerophora amabilis]